jgi:RsbT co-antagonist protein rsbRD N-terminal domain
MLKKILSQNKNIIVEKWIQSIISSYPKETYEFLRLQKNRFSNPAGYIISDGAEKIFNELIKSFNSKIINQSLNDIIRLRAVQEFLPSQAVGFVFLLKQIIRSEIDPEVKNEETSQELMDLDSRIDKIALMAFDLYAEARETIYQIRLKELKASLPYNGEVDINRRSK